MAAFGRFMLVVLICIVGSFLGAYTTIKLWEWFVMTNFDVKMISIPSALGLALFVQYLTHQTKINDNDKFDDEYLVKLASIVFTKPLIFLAVGYVYHLFM